MAHLTLAGMSDDGKRLLLVSDAGVEFTLDIDRRLRSALRGDTARLGQLEITMDSTLRPRDIQARIRAGESAEAVAQAAQTSVDKIMAFAGPVLAERQHVAERAQRSSVRRPAGESTGNARTLGDAVAAHLRSHNVDPSTVEWDAWRREDGRWALTGQFGSIKRSGTAQFTYDAPGNFVVLENEDARWLVGEAVAASAGAPASRDDLQRARQRRLGAVPEDELPLGDDAIELVNESKTEAATPAAEQYELTVEQPLEAFLDEGPGAEPELETQLIEEAADAAALDADPSAELPSDHDPADDEPPARRPVKKSRGRASVPSWDEIMFGGGKQD
ncbi:MAG: DNA-binding protein [Nocardioides sp.]|nr:DNA-binding protein [Nocardioides sp.]